MSLAPVAPELPQVVARLDTIIHELEALRRQLMPITPPPLTPNLVDQLYGAAGRGTPGEYDLNLDWSRFAE
jgi:hypothetical protein